MNFAEFIKLARVQLFLSQKDFAQAVGVGLTTLKQWERGEFLPSYSNFKKLLKYFELDVSKRMDMLLIYEREKAGM